MWVCLCVRVWVRAPVHGWGKSRLQPHPLTCLLCSFHPPLSSSPKGPSLCRGPLPLPLTRPGPPLVLPTSCSALGRSSGGPPNPGAPSLLPGEQRLLGGPRASLSSVGGGGQLRGKGRSVGVAEAELAADDGHMRAKAQGGDVRAATVARFGHQRQVNDAEGDSWGGQKINRASSLRL